MQAEGSHATPWLAPQSADVETYIKKLILNLAVFKYLG